MAIHQPELNTTRQTPEPPTTPVTTPSPSRFNWLRKLVGVSQADSKPSAADPALSESIKVPQAQVEALDTEKLATPQEPRSPKAPKVRGSSSANTTPKRPMRENPKQQRRQERVTKRAEMRNRKAISQNQKLATPADEINYDLREEQEFLKTASPEEIRNVAQIRLETLIRAQSPPVILQPNDTVEYSSLVNQIPNADQAQLNIILEEVGKKLAAANVVDSTWDKILKLELAMLRQLPESKSSRSANSPPRTFGFRNGKLMQEEKAVNAPSSEASRFFEHSAAQLPEVVNSWEKTNTNIILTSDQLPWGREQSGYLASLDLVTLTLPNSGRTRQIYLGMNVNNDKLKEALDDLMAHPEEAQVAQEVFFRDLGVHVNGDANRTLEHGRSSLPINVASNGGKGERVYFIEPGNIDGKRVVVVIGACRKATQGDFSSAIWGYK